MTYVAAEKSIVNKPRRDEKQDRKLTQVVYEHRRALHKRQNRLLLQL